MPEGDTIHKVAAVMNETLAGETVKHCIVRGRAPRNDSNLTVDGVGAHGKHLFVNFDDGRALRSHLGMHGSWHRYPPGAAWRKPRRLAAIELHTEPWEFVCFNAKEVEWLRQGSFRHRDLLAFLGPDVVVEAPPIETVLERVRNLLPGDAPAVDVLLDQRVAAGIGNVYKSEVLFIHRVHPATMLETMSDTLLAELFEESNRLLRRNLGGGPRVTRDDGAAHKWVYGRKGKPCAECGGAIRMERMGKHLRVTYFCPLCQGSQQGRRHA